MAVRQYALSFINGNNLKLYCFYSFTDRNILEMGWLTEVKQRGNDATFAVGNKLDSIGKLNFSAHGTSEGKKNPLKLIYESGTIHRSQLFC